jgi:hypothetical protein
VLALALVAIAATGHASAVTLVPPKPNVLFGVSDKGSTQEFNEFAELLAKHPALLETFHPWGNSLNQSYERWRETSTRPILAISTIDDQTLSELITPEQIALGAGDDYLLQLNDFFAKRGLPAYIRPLGEPNRCLNVYASYDCAGALRDAAHKPRWYRLAFRRMYVLLHGGGKRNKIDTRLEEAGLPPLQSEVNGLPRAPIAVLWSTLPAGSPTVPQNRPRHFYPGDDYVDWVGTDFYSDNQDWKALTGLYNRFANKPFALPEFGVSNGDDPAYMTRLMGWVRGHKRCKMLIYYQDFGSTSAYRIQNYPASLAVLTDALHHPVFPAFAPNPPVAPPPPPGGLAPRG